MTLNFTLILRSTFSIMDFHVIRSHCVRLLVLALMISTSTGSSESVPTSSAEKGHGRHDPQSHSVTKRESGDVFDKRFFMDEGRKRTRKQLYNFFNSVGIRSPSKHIHRFVGKRTAERTEVPVHVLSPAFAMGPILGDEFARYVRRIPRLSLAFVGKRRIKPFSFYPKRLTSTLISRQFPAYEHKFIGKRSFLIDEGNDALDDDNLDDNFDNFKWSDIENKAPIESEFPRIEESAEVDVDKNNVFNRYISNFLNDRSSFHSISKRDVSSLDQDFSSIDTSKLNDNSDLEFLKNFISVLNKDGNEDDKNYDFLKTDDDNMSQELEDPVEKRVPDFHSYVGKRVPDFHSFVGKRVPDFHSFVGKRVPDFHSFVGKRVPDFHSFVGKRVPDFHSFVGKRIPDFHSFVGKRAPDFHSFVGKRAPDFHSFVGKRAPDFHSFVGKRAPDFHSFVGKRAPDFHSFVGKRAPDFHSFVGKRAPDFHSFVGKRAPDFHSFVGKRAPDFHSFVGKRVPDFHSFVGKRIPDFHSFVGKRIPDFHSFVGKRAPDFHSFVGKRAPDFHSFVGKRAPDFHSFVGKRIPDFHSFVGKRIPDFHSFVGKRIPDFHSFVGKRIPDFHSFVGKRIPDFHSFVGKRIPDFHSFVGKRVPDFHSFVGKRFPKFHSFVGKRVPDFHSFVGKRLPDFHSFVGKRAPAFHSFVGKRDPESPDSLLEKRATESDFASTGGLADQDVGTLDMDDQMLNGNSFLNLLDDRNAYFTTDGDQAADPASNPSLVVDGNSLSASSKSAGEKLAKDILTDSILSQEDAALPSETQPASSSNSDGSAAKT